MSQVSDRISIVLGDITQQNVDAIVNAANSTLLGGGGVDGAIHRAAGPELLAACRKFNGCRTGENAITPGFNLPAKWVIHAVGPRYFQPRHKYLLRNCYVNSIWRTIEHDIKSIAFPAISTGIYGYPIVEATEIAMTTVADMMGMPQSLDLLVTFVCFSAADYDVYCIEFNRQFGIPYQGDENTKSNVG